MLYVDKEITNILLPKGLTHLYITNYSGYKYEWPETLTHLTISNYYGGDLPETLMYLEIQLDVKGNVRFNEGLKGLVYYCKYDKLNILTPNPLPSSLEYLDIRGLNKYAHVDLSNLVNLKVLHIDEYLYKFPPNLIYINTNYVGHNMMKLEKLEVLILKETLSVNNDEIP